MTMTNAQVIAMEASPKTTKAHRFTLNWTRNQYGMRVARRVAELIAAGHEVTVAQFGTGFIVDGEQRQGSEL